MPTPNRSLKGQAVPVAGIVFSAAESCPIPESYVGFWLDEGGNLNLRAADGTDGVVAKNVAPPSSLQTTNAAPTTIETIAIPPNRCVTLEAQITGLKADASAGAGYTLRATFRNQGGVVAQVGSTEVDFIEEDDPAWGDPSLVIDGTSVLVNVEGKGATTINWTSSTSTFGA